MSHVSKYILIKTKFITQLYLVPRLRMSGVIPPLHLYDFYFKRKLYLRRVLEAVRRIVRLTRNVCARNTFWAHSWFL